ncbi:MAG: zinc ribbon domain-containing protein [Oscillospiraceae bacterium]|nr:zinc ribbon domain-containing protein [Oscillospiraceae bacterium]
MHTSKATVVASTAFGKIATLIGIILIAASVPFLFMFIADMHGTGALEALFLFILPALIAGIVLLWKGSQIKSRIRRFKTYVSLISMQNITSLDEISANTGRSTDFVRADLQEMIRRKFFVKAYIDVASNKIVILCEDGSVAQNTVNTSAVLGCSHCGARRTSTSNYCEYCGSLLQMY